MARWEDDGGRIADDVADLISLQSRIDKATAAQRMVGDTGRGQKTYAATSSNATRTSSGWGSKPSGVTNGIAAVDELANNMNYTFPSYRFDPPGQPGRYYSSHAEVQMAALHPNEPIGVSNVMCASCRDFFSALAQYRNDVQIVADPRHVHIFYPDGTIQHVRR